MKKLLLILALICVVAYLIFGTSLFKSDEDKIRDRIDSFATAYNTGDMDETIECLDAKTRNMYQSILGIAGSFLPVDLGDLFGLSVGVVSEGELLQIHVKQIQIQGDTAKAYADMRYEDIYGQQSDAVIFIMVKESNDWFIKDIKNEN